MPFILSSSFPAKWPITAGEKTTGMVFWSQALSGTVRFCTLRFLWTPPLIFGEIVPMIPTRFPEKIQLSIYLPVERDGTIGITNIPLTMPHPNLGFRRNGIPVNCSLTQWPNWVSCGDANERRRHGQWAENGDPAMSKYVMQMNGTAAVTAAAKKGVPLPRKVMWCSCCYGKNCCDSQDVRSHVPFACLSIYVCYFDWFWSWGLYDNLIIIPILNIQYWKDTNSSYNIRAAQSEFGECLITYCTVRTSLAIEMKH